MYKKTNKIIVLFIFLIVLIIIFAVKKNDNFLAIPNPEKLNKIVLIDIIDGRGTQKNIITEQKDIKKLLDLISDSEKTSKESISNFPNKTNFTAIIFDFKSNGKSHRSIYNEDDKLYIDQPYNGIYKLNLTNLYELDEIVNKGCKEDISIELENILQNTF